MYIDYEWFQNFIGSLRAKAIYMNEYRRLNKEQTEECVNIIWNAASVIEELVGKCKKQQEEISQLKALSDVCCLSDDITPIGGIHDVDNNGFGLNFNSKRKAYYDEDDLPPIGGFHD